jgi:hypothetical protein
VAAATTATRGSAAAAARPTYEDLQTLCSTAAADPVASSLHESLRVLMEAVDTWKASAQQ